MTIKEMKAAKEVLRGKLRKLRKLHKRMLEQASTESTEDVVKRRCEFIAAQTATEIEQTILKLEWTDRMINTLHAKASCDKNGNLIHRPFAAALKHYKVANA